MITREQKEQRVKEITEDLKGASLIILTDYRGLNVSEISNLRKELRQTGCKYRVVKNKLSKIAAKEAGVDALNPNFEGPTAIAISDDDPVEVTKILLKWGKETKKLSVKAGMLDGSLLEQKDVEALGTIPPKEVLLAQVCGAFQAPISGLATALQGNVNKLVYALDKIRQEKEAS